MKHLVEGTPADQITAEVGAIALDTQKAQAGNQFNALATKYAEDLKQQILSEDGTEIISLEGPELEDVRQGWVTAVEAGNITGVAASYTDAIAIIRQAERAQAKTNQEHAIALERAAAKERAEEAGLNDLGTGNNAQPTTGQDDGLWGESRIAAAVADRERRGEKVVSNRTPGGGG